MSRAMSTDYIDVYNAMFSTPTSGDIVAPSTKKFDKKEAIIAVRDLLETKATNSK